MRYTVHLRGTKCHKNVKLLRIICVFPVESALELVLDPPQDYLGKFSRTNRPVSRL